MHLMILGWLSNILYIAITSRYQLDLFSLLISFKADPSDIHLPSQDTNWSKEIPIELSHTISEQLHERQERNKIISLKHHIVFQRLDVDINTPIQRTVLDICSCTGRSITQALISNYHNLTYQIISAPTLINIDRRIPYHPLHMISGNLKISNKIPNPYYTRFTNIICRIKTNQRSRINKYQSFQYNKGQNET